MLAFLGHVCWTSLEIALEKNTVNSFFLLKEMKRQILDMFGKKGDAVTCKIFPSPTPQLNHRKEGV